MTNFFKESFALMPGRGRSHWKKPLQENAAEDALMHAHKKAGKAMKRVLGDLSKYGPTGSGWSTSVDLTRGRTMFHLEVGGQWHPRPGEYLVYFKFVGPSFERTPAVKSIAKDMRRDLARTLKRYGDVGVDHQNNIAVLDVTVSSDKIDDLIKRLPRIAADWAEDVAGGFTGIDLGEARSLEESKTPVFGPYTAGMWVIQVEDYLYKTTGKKFTWKKPILSMEGGKKIQYKWVGRKPRGKHFNPMFTATMEYKPGPDLFDIESAYYDDDLNIVASKTLHGIGIGNLLRPETLFGWVKRKWNRKTGMKAESIDAWARKAKELIKKHKGKGQKDLHYRAYLRAVADGNQAQATHMRSKFAGAKEAAQDLIDALGLAAYGESIEEAEVTAKGLAYSAVRALRGLEKKGVSMEDLADSLGMRLSGAARGLKHGQDVSRVRTHLKAALKNAGAYVMPHGDDLLNAMVLGARASSDAAAFLGRLEIEVLKAEKAGASVESLGNAFGRALKRTMKESLEEARATTRSPTSDEVKELKKFVRSVNRRIGVRTIKHASGTTVDIQGQDDGSGSDFVKIAKWLIKNGWRGKYDHDHLRKMIPNAKKYDAFYGMGNMQKLEGAPRTGNLTEGKAEDGLLAALKRYGGSAPITDLAALIRGVHYAGIERAAKKLVRQGKLSMRKDSRDGIILTLKEGAPGPFAVSDNPPSLKDMIDSVKEQIKAPSWTYPSWALPKVALDEDE